MIVVVAGSVSALESYSTYSDNECNKGLCTMVIYSTPTNVYEDNEWKHYTEARSLKDKEGFEIKFLEIDENYPLEIVDYNATSITVDLKKWTILNKDIDLRIWKSNETSILEEFKNTYEKVFHEKEKFTILDLGSKERTYNFKIGDVLEFGPNSTSVTLEYTKVDDDAYIKRQNPTNTYDDDTLYVSEGASDWTFFSFIKFDVSTIPSNTEIISADLSLYLEHHDVDVGETLGVYIHHIYNTFSWDEDTITWDTRPDSGTEYNPTYESNLAITSTTTQNTRYEFIIKEMVQTVKDAEDNEVSIYLIADDIGTDYGDEAFFSSREEDTSSKRPKLYITYADMPDIQIDYPLSLLYDEVTQFDWTLSDPDSQADECWYSLNGAANETVNCNTETESITSISGNNVLKLWMNNLYGGVLKYETVNYSVKLEGNIEYPQDIIYGANVTELNYTYITPNPDKCWYSNDSGVTNYSIQDCTSNFTGMINEEGVNTWILYINSTTGLENSTNVTFTVDTTQPALDITYPLDFVNYHLNNTNLRLTFTHSDDNPDDCWLVYGGSNVSVTCGLGYHDINITNMTDTNLTIYANDSTGNEVNSSVSWAYKLFGKSLDYNTTTYETSIDSYTLSLTSNGSEIVTATLNYNGTIYPATKTGTDYNMIFTSTLPAIAEGDIGNKSFYWNFSYGEESFPSTTYYQDVQELLFVHCNASNGEMFINFTFLDEGNSTAIKSKFQTTTWKYWIGDGTVNKTLSYTNITAGYNVSFCLNNNYTLYTLGDIRYEDTEYPQRLWTESSTLTNDTTTRILYMLHEDDGIYSTIQIVDQQGDAVIDALVTVERQISGVWTTVAQSSSDSAGLVTFWVNPNYDHRFTFVKDGCIGQTFTLRPTQATYTAQLDCQGAPTTYISPIDGLKYARFPAEGIISPGITNFTFQTLSSKGNLNQIKIEIINATNYILATSTSDCSTTTSDCMVWVEYNVPSGADLKGIYYVDIGNGLFAIEADARWINVDDTPSGSLDVFTFINDLKFALDGWSTDDNTGDFNRLVFAFFFMCLFICIFNAYTGMDNANPGAFMIFLTAVVFIGSIANGGTGQGFFYYNNLSNYTFMNNYILLILLSFITMAQVINTNRQAAK